MRSSAKPYSQFDLGGHRFDVPGDGFDSHLTAMRANKGGHPRPISLLRRALLILRGCQRTAMATRHPDLKTVIGASLSRVQIPAPPPIPCPTANGNERLPCGIAGAF
jgi:hypothetical protein